MPTAEETKLKSEGPEMPLQSEVDALLPKETGKFMRCYSVRHGLNFNVRQDIIIPTYNARGAVASKEVVDPGYCMQFINHRCDVPLDPKQDMELVDDEGNLSPSGRSLRVKKNPNPKALIIACLAQRKRFGENEWRTAPELAKVIDDPSDTFIRRMYNLSVACGKIRPADQATKRDAGISESQFVLMLRQELIELGYDPLKYKK